MMSIKVFMIIISGWQGGDGEWGIGEWWMVNWQLAINGYASIPLFQWRPFLYWWMLEAILGKLTNDEWAIINGENYQPLLFYYYSIMRSFKPEFWKDWMQKDQLLIDCHQYSTLKTPFLPLAYRLNPLLKLSVGQCLFTFRLALRQNKRTFAA